MENVPSVPGFRLSLDFPNAKSAVFKEKGNSTMTPLLVEVFAFLFLFVVMAFGIIVLCYPNLAERLMYFNVPESRRGRWPHNRDPRAWSTRLSGLMYIIGGAAGIVWLLMKMFAVR